MEKSANFAGKVQISKDFQGQILRKIGRFHGKFRQETISKKHPISLDFFGQISLKSTQFSRRYDQRCLTFFNWDNNLLFQQQY